MADKMLLDVVPDGHLVDASKVSIAADLIPTMFAVAARRETSSVEANFWGSLRYGYKGTRQVLMVPLLPSLEHLARQKGGKPVELQVAYDWLKACTIEGVRGLASDVPSGEVPSCIFPCLLRVVNPYFGQSMYIRPCMYVFNYMKT